MEIVGSKYTLCKVNFLDEALYLCSVFQSKKIRDAKVNLHPKSTRRWSTDEFIEWYLLWIIIKIINIWMIPKLK